MRASLAQRWARNIALHPPRDQKDIDQGIAHVFAIDARARNPEPIPYSEGWCPFRAGDFLAASNLQTRDYHRLLAEPEEWFAESAPLEIGSGILPPTITYRIYGNERATTRLRLELFGTDMADEQDARMQFTALVPTVAEIIRCVSADLARRQSS